MVTIMVNHDVAKMVEKWLVMMVKKMVLNDGEKMSIMMVKKCQ